MAFTGTIAAGKTWTIDTSQRTIKDNLGVSQFDKLNVTSSWLDIQPGSNVIDFTASGMTATRSGVGAAASGPSATIQHSDTWM